jgi:hypothetical protein
MTVMAMVRNSRRRACETCGHCQPWVRHVTSEIFFLTISKPLSPMASQRKSIRPPKFNVPVMGTTIPHKADMEEIARKHQEVDECSQKYFLGYGLVEYWNLAPKHQYWNFGSSNARGIDTEYLTRLKVAFSSAEFRDNPVDRAIPVGVKKSAISNLADLVKDATKTHSTELPKINWDVEHLKYESIIVFNGRVC